MPSDLCQVSRVFSVKDVKYQQQISDIKVSNVSDRGQMSVTYVKCQCEFKASDELQLSVTDVKFHLSLTDIENLKVSQTK